MNRRILINLVAFAVVSAIVIGWSITTLFEIDRLEKPYMVTAQFESSPGLARGYEVTYLGHAIGSVDTVRLADGFSEVDLKIDQGVDVPIAVTAAARRKSAIGEPYVDLTPKVGTDANDGERLVDGDLIPLEDTSIPISYSELFSALNALVDAVDPAQVKIVLDETAAAIADRGDDIRRIIVGARDLTANTARDADRIDALIADLGSISSVLADNRDSLGGAVDQLAVLSNSLDSVNPSLDRFLTTAPDSFALVARIIEASDGALVCTIDGLSVLPSVATDDVLAALTGTLQEAGLAEDVIDQVIGDDGYLSLDVLLSPLETAPSYAAERPEPVAPTVPVCPPRPNTYTDAPEAASAPVGPGGTSQASPDDPIDAPTAAPFVPDPGPSGSSDLDAPDDPPLQRVLDNSGSILLVLVALGAIAFAASRLLAAVRRDRKDKPDDDVESVEDALESMQP